MDQVPLVRTLTVAESIASATNSAAADEPTRMWWLAPTPVVLITSILIAALIPLFLHFVIYRSGANSTLPTFLLVGPSGSGKTAISTLIERGKAATTCTSQAPKTVEASVPVQFEVASNRYRSVNDPSATIHKKFLLTDTPGHGKLRHHAIDVIKRQEAHLRGILFVVDATALAPGSGELSDVASYLHDVLLDLQIARSGKSSGGGGVPALSKSNKDFPVLIVVNKLDLFTAIPPEMARAALEQEITKIRVSRSKGILDATVGTDSLDDEREWLGAGGEGAFTFDQMEDAGVVVTLQGSRAEGAETETEKSGIDALWEWMGEQL